MSRHLAIMNRLEMGSAIFLTVVLLAIIFSGGIFSSGLFDLHGECYRWIPSLVVLHVVSDMAIGLAYFFISGMLFISLRLLKLPFQTIFIAFGAFIICCGATHFMEVVTTLWIPIYWFAGFIKLVTAIVSICTAIMLPPLIPQVRAALANAKRVEEQSREIVRSYEKYIALADAMPLLVWVRNAHDEFEFFNTMWRSYTGESEQLLGAIQKGTFVHPDDYSRGHDDWQHKRQQGVAYEAEVRLKRHDGTFRWHLIRNLPLREPDGTIEGWVGTATDIEKQKRNEQVLREAKQQQDIFLAMVSHELKTPLTSMQLLISFFRREITDVKYNKAITTIENQLQRIVRLIDDLLDMSRVQTNQLSFTFVSCDMIKIAHEVLDRMQISTNTHKLVMVCDTIAWVQADPDRLEQVIINLLTNAIKYSPQADRVDIRITSHENALLFSVQDYGIGVSPAAQAHIFEQYYRSTEASQQKYPGLGVGLYIASEIIKHHHGQIWVESEKGRGSIFSFALPLKREDNGTET